MPKVLTRTWTPVSILVAANLTLVVLYVALIAVVMSYAALQVEFAQSVKSDQATVAEFEAKYLSEIARITSTDYLSQGYTHPSSVVFVAGAPRTALNTR